MPIRAIVTLNRKCRGNAISVEGNKLKDVLPHLKRGVLDVMVEVKFKRRKYRGKRTTVTKLFRVVAVLNKETGDYHIYMGSSLFHVGGMGLRYSIKDISW